MANNFHDTGGLLMVGVDLHLALLIPGIVPFAPFVPFPKPRTPHINFLHPFTMGENQKPSVQFNGRPSVVHWHSPKHLWPHITIPPFPFDILIPLHLLVGQQTAWLPKSTVFITDEPATCTNIGGPLSTNLDCWDFANIPSSLVVQPGTVQTTATLADYKMGLQAFAVDFAIAVVFNVFGDVFVGVAAQAARAARRAATRAVTRAFGDGATSAARRTANSVRSRFVARGASPRARRLAAEAGDSAYHRAARREVIEDYATNNGFGRAGRPLPPSQPLTGADLSQPVRIVDFPPPDTLNQWVMKDGHPGNWFAPKVDGVPQTGDALGLNTVTGHRELWEFPVTGEGQALSSTAAPITDTWTAKDIPIDTQGGGEQWLITSGPKSELAANGGPAAPRA